MNELHVSPTCSCEIQLGDIQSEEERDIVLELSLPAVDGPQEVSAMKASLSYFNVVSSTLDTVDAELVVRRSGK